MPAEVTSRTVCSTTIVVLPAGFVSVETVVGNSIISPRNSNGPQMNQQAIATRITAANPAPAL